MNPYSSSPPPGTWMERVSLARAACAALASQPDDAGLAEKVATMAADPKWEVRLVIAEALPTFPDSLFRVLSITLANDHNFYVAKTATKSADRRAPVSGLEAATPGKIQLAFNRFAAQHGQAAASAAAQFAGLVVERHMSRAAHDIKNILTQFNFNDDDFRSTTAAQKKNAQRYQRGRSYLMNLMTMMIHYAEPPVINRTSENLADMVTEAYSSAVSQIEGAGNSVANIRFESRLHSEATAFVSHFHMTMVLTNLIKNGLEAHAISPTESRAGSVTVTSEIQGDRLSVEVADEGGGLSPLELSRLREFIPGSSSKRGAGSSSGSGYGLPICHRYVILHNGELTLQSAEGRGTTIRFWIPRN
ncbi:hypothetical protein DB346_09765 [Verrucomicrobia bacterium LW23]|nr:hypothetical protein DB346_09765 [Verrucomicrobia bacterium LW23]